jgi:transcriptional regulator with XRE-family HTH domain
MTLGMRLRPDSKILEGLGVRQIARMTGLQPMTVSRCLNGTADPSREVMCAFAETFGVPMKKMHKLFEQYDREES